MRNRIDEGTGSSGSGSCAVEIRDRVRELRRVKAKELRHNPKNWRRHPQAQADALRGLLSEIGYADALLAREQADGSLMLIDGHLRAETTPDTVVPVLVVDVTEDEADKLLLTLDPLAGMAQADSERIKALLATVKSDDEAVGALLEMIADQAEPRENQPGPWVDPEPQIDQAAELQKHWGTAQGQIWQIGSARLACGDSTDAALVARLFQDRKARMVWTDPPYGVSYASKNEYLNRGDRGNRIQKPIVNDDLSSIQLRELFRHALRQALEHAVTGAVCYASVPSGPLLPMFIAGYNDSGFSFKHQLIWLKQQFVIGMSDYHYRYESILYGWRDGAHYFVDDRSQSNVFEVDKPHINDRHPTSKPTELVGRMIANSSRPGEIVYDPFCGSGTTLVSAHQLRRIGYAMEIDLGYAAVTLERMTQLGLKPELIEI
jgi:DNA modification methylase